MYEGSSLSVTGAVHGSALGEIADLASALPARARQENFPVAFRALPRDLRSGLVAIYDVARVIDIIGDELPGDRLALLDLYETDLLLAWGSSQPALEVNRALQAQVRRHALRDAPFRALIEANRRDQTQTRYPTWADLLGYCELSANPVGQVVLELVERRDSQREQWSNDVCTALQVLEHCQDVGEDRRAGRVYLPADDLAAHAVGETDLDAATASTALRATILELVARSRELLSSGRPLVKSLRGAGRIAVAGFVAGGLATADAIEAAGGEVLAEDVKPRKRDVLRHGARLVVGR